MKLSKLKLKDFHEMNASEMKNVVGGWLDNTTPGEGGVTVDGTLADCSATCSDGTTVSITDCTGTCTSADSTDTSKGYAKCEGPTKTITKTCS